MGKNKTFLYIEKNAHTTTNQFSEGTSFATRGQTMFKKIGHKPDSGDHKPDRRQSNCKVT